MVATAKQRDYYERASSPEERDRVKALLIAGKTVPEVAKLTGFSPGKIHGWQTRFGWRKLVKSVRTITTTVQGSQDQGVADASTQTKRALAKELEKLSSALAEVPAPDLTLPAIRNRLSVCKPMIEAGRALHGWGNDSQTTTTVSIDELTGFSPGEDSTPLLAQSPIDADPQPSAESSAEPAKVPE